MNTQSRLRRAWHEQWGSQGLEAAGAALAAAIIIGALLLMAPSVGDRVERALSCAASVLTGGGSCASGEATNGGEAPTASQPAESNDDDCSFFCQVGGFFKGVGEGAVDFVKGIGSLAVDGFKLATGDQETRDKYAQLGQAFVDDPLGTLKAVGEGIIEPMVTDWKNGNYGEAIGRGFFEVASTIIGDKGIGKLGKLGKVDDVARAANPVDDAARGANRIDDVARQLDNIPCVGYAAPKGRGPGLAAPLREGCARGPRAAANAARAERSSIEAARRLGGDINYGRLDDLNRPSGIEATITKDMIDGDIGTSANSRIHPPGWDDMDANNRGRGHLLGRQLGGSGDVDSNLVSLIQNPVNSPIMSGFEGQVRRAVEAGETVRYRVTPIYRGNDLIPYEVRIEAIGDGGFRLNEVIRNAVP